MTSTAGSVSIWLHLIRSSSCWMQPSYHIRTRFTGQPIVPSRTDSTCGPGRSVRVRYAANESDRGGFERDNCSNIPYSATICTGEKGKENYAADLAISQEICSRAMSSRLTRVDMETRTLISRLDQIVKPLTLLHDVNVGHVKTLRSSLSMYASEYLPGMLSVTFMLCESPSGTPVLSLGPPRGTHQAFKDDRQLVAVDGHHIRTAPCMVKSSGVFPWELGLVLVNCLHADLSAISPAEDINLLRLHLNLTTG